MIVISNYWVTVTVFTLIIRFNPFIFWLSWASIQFKYWSDDQISYLTHVEWHDVCQDQQLPSFCSLLYQTVFKVSNILWLRRWAAAEGWATTSGSTAGLSLLEGKIQHFLFVHIIFILTWKCLFCFGFV